LQVNAASLLKSENIQHGLLRIDRFRSLRIAGSTASDYKTSKHRAFAYYQINLIVVYFYFFHVFFLLTDIPKVHAHPRGKLQGRREGSRDV
jgi:hypothetical protein